MNLERIAERYGVTLQQAQALREYVDEQVDIDWSEASWAQIDDAMHRASCALFNRAARNQEQRAASREGMKNFRARLLESHKRALAGQNPDVLRRDDTGRAAREFHAHYIEGIEKAQRRLGEAK